MTTFDIVGPGPQTGPGTFSDAGGARTPGSYYLYPGTPSPAWWNAPSNPWSIGAGTSEQGYGWGVPGFGQAPIQIQPDYLQYLQGQTTGERGGYIPGSGSFNGWNLSQPGLVGTVGGVPNQNLRYGQGGTGDPTTGREPQTPDEWLNGPKAFSWEGNMGQTDATRGLDYIANLFGRPDAGTSGISTAAWSAPAAYWQGLAQAVQAGTVKASAFGLKALASKGFNVQPPGGAVDLGGGTGGAGGTGGTGGTGSTQNALASIAASQAADQAARLAYTQWQMRTGDEQLAMQKAQQAWTQTFQEKQAEAQALGTYGGQQTQAAQQQAFAQEMSRAQFQFQQDQAELAQRLAEAGLTGTYQGQATMAKLQQDFNMKMTELQSRMTEAGLTGTYNGQQTQQAQQQAWSQNFQTQGQQASNALALLGLQAGMQGPRDYARYQALSANTPGGLQQMLQGFAGQYGFAGSGAQGTPGPATLQSRTQDLLSGGQLGQGGQQQTAQPTAGGTPEQNGYALPAPNQINLRNWQAASPSQQQMLLGGYEAAGFYGPDVERQIAASAPRYTGPATTQVGF